MPEGVTPNLMAVIKAAFGSHPDRQESSEVQVPPRGMSANSEKHPSYIGSPRQNAGVQNMAQYS